MKLIHKTLILGLVLAAGAASAKEGVQNPTVAARMNAMQTIRANVAALGDMASGKATFDATAAQAAKAAIAATVTKVPALFEPQETDPVSEAKADIWTNWADFLSKADGLGQAAAALDASSVDGIKAGMGAIGGACKACHSTFRM